MSSQTEVAEYVVSSQDLQQAHVPLDLPSSQAMAQFTFDPSLSQGMMHMGTDPDQMFQPGMGGRLQPYMPMAIDGSMGLPANMPMLQPGYGFLPGMDLYGAQALHDMHQSKHYSMNKPEHEESRAKRRGPMDEMRQLVRILVKFLPQSVKFLSNTDEPGGGNRVTEPQIKSYLKHTIGEEAPQPQWGMPNGWGAYLAELFTWSLGRAITDDQARACARRQQGRSWQIIETELARLGIYAYAWPLPLTVAGVGMAQTNPGPPPHGSSFVGPPAGWPHVGLPAPEPQPAKEPRKRVASEGKSEEEETAASRWTKAQRSATVSGPSIPPGAAVPGTGPMLDTEKLTEVECLHLALQYLRSAQRKALKGLSQPGTHDEVVSLWTGALQSCTYQMGRLGGQAAALAQSNPAVSAMQPLPISHLNTGQRTSSLGGRASGSPRQFSTALVPLPLLSSQPMRGPPAPGRTSSQQPHQQNQQGHKYGDAHTTYTESQFDALAAAAADMRRQDGITTPDDVTERSETPDGLHPRTSQPQHTYQPARRQLPGAHTDDDDDDDITDGEGPLPMPLLLRPDHLNGNSFQEHLYALEQLGREGSRHDNSQQPERAAASQKWSAPTPTPMPSKPVEGGGGTTVTRSKPVTIFAAVASSGPTSSSAIVKPRGKTSASSPTETGSPGQKGTAPHSLATATQARNSLWQLLG